MTKLYATVLLIILYSVANAQKVNTLLKDTDVKNTNNWSQKRYPVTGDTVVIPKDAVYTFKEDVDLSSQDLYVKVEGSVILDQASIKLSKNSELVLTTKSATVNADRAKGNSIIFVGTDIKYKGSDGLEVGPAYINKSVSTFTEFTPTALPVKFIHFSAGRTANGAAIQWATSEEVGASHYEVERSEDGINWKKLASVFAAGNSTVVNNYAYTDRTPVNRMAYFRIRQVDVDGRFTYTAVKAIAAAEAASMAAVSISSTTSSHVIIQFAQQIKTPVQVRIVSLSGQVVAQQEYKQAGSQIVLQQTGAAKGAYIICLTDGGSLKVAKQVML